MTVRATSYMIDDYLAMFQFSDEWSPLDCSRGPSIVKYPAAAPFYGRLYGKGWIIFLRDPNSNEMTWRTNLAWVWQQLGQDHSLELAAEPALMPFFVADHRSASYGAQLHGMGNEVFLIRMTRPFTPVILVSIEGVFAGKQTVVMWRRRRSRQGMSSIDESPDAFRDRLQRTYESLSRQPFESNFHSTCR